MSGSLSTIGKLKALQFTTNLNATRFSALCELYGFKVSDSAITRATQKGKFTGDLDNELRPLILGIEKLIGMARPFKISFEDIEHVQVLLGLIDAGLSWSPVPNSSNETTTPSPDNPDGEAASNSLPENQNEGNRL